jgi:adenine C2-methylase RlmN of 23S rRNA A2503 and tRNA A37
MTASTSVPVSTNKKYRDPPSRPTPVLDRKLFEQSLPRELRLAINTNNGGSSSGVVVPNKTTTNSTNKNVVRGAATSTKTNNTNMDHQIDVLHQLLHKAKYPSDLSIFFGSLEKTNKDNTKRAPKGMSLNLVRYLQENSNKYTVKTSRILSSHTSSDGSTTKLAIELHDHQVIETVIMRHGRRNNGTGAGNHNGTSTGSSRNTICVSSQVGCAMQCSFCATGTMGIRGNLCHAEIIEQLVHASHYLQAEAAQVEQQPQQQHVQEEDTQEETQEAEQPQVEDTTTAQQLEIKRNIINSKKKHITNNNNSNRNDHLIRNVVFMGMGEPLNNYPNVLQAAKDLICRRTWSLQYHHVTISTVGVIPNMLRLSKDLPHVNLALSLHAPFQDLRLKIVPTAKHYPMQDMMDALDNHMRSSENSSSDNNSSSRLRGGEDEKKEDCNNLPTAEETAALALENKLLVEKKPPVALSKKMKKRAMIEYVMCKSVW